MQEQFSDAAISDETHGIDGTYRVDAPRLSNPITSLSLYNCPSIWRYCQVRVMARRPRSFEDGPSLAGRLRGAWGLRLLDLAKQDARALNIAPDNLSRSAHALFFRSQMKDEFGRETPKPYTLRTQSRGGDIFITLTIFGFALRWAHDAITALLDVLRNGIFLDQTSSIRATIPVTSIDVVRREIVTYQAPATTASAATLLFDSPVTVQSGKGVTILGDQLIHSMHARIVALAPWQDVRLIPLSAESDEFQYAFETAELDTSELKPVQWHRRSMRQPGKTIPMLGFTGPVRLRGDIHALMPLLTLSSLSHVGAKCSFGHGHFQLIL